MIRTACLITILIFCLCSACRRDRPDLPISVEGIVLSEEGSQLSIENIEVTLLSVPDFNLFRVSEVVARDTTDADGRYLLTWTSEEDRDYRVWVAPNPLLNTASRSAVEINEWEENTVDLALEEETIIPLRLLGDSILLDFQEGHSGLLEIESLYLNDEVGVDFPTETTIQLDWKTDTTIFLRSSPFAHIWVNFSPLDYPSGSDFPKGFEWDGIPDGTDTMEISLDWK